MLSLEVMRKCTEDGGLRKDSRTTDISIIGTSVISVNSYDAHKTKMRETVSFFFFFSFSFLRFF